VEKGKLSRENEMVDEESINDNMAVWVRILNSDQAERTYVIEWTNLNKA